ncbi:MAG TPA: hypothetical protein VNT58_04650, partial [Gaiellaceae bacterium]|nr:hypothetical protein [Gaiellaceae bacterium]
GLPRGVAATETTKMTPEQERAARNERLFREINDRVQRLNDEAGRASAGEFVCECSNSDCTRPIRVPLEEFAAARTDESLFLLAPGHERDDIERVVDRRPGYLVVAKKLGG